MYEKDYIQMAKDAALNNLASQITVNISGEKIRAVIEKSGMVEDEFKRHIRTSTKAELEGFELARFDAATSALLDEVLPTFAHRGNPIDCTPMTATEAFTRSTQAILDCPQVDLAIVSSVPVTPALENLEPDRFGAHTENLYAPTSQPQRLGEILGRAAKPAVVVVDSGRIYDPMALMIERAGVPVFRKIDRAARALAAFCELST